MQETFHGHYTFISISRRPICNLPFAADIDLMGGNNGKLQDLTNRLIDKTRAYGMEVSTEMSKIKTNSMNNISADKVTVKSENIKIAALSILLVTQHSQVLEASQKAKFY